MVATVAHEVAVDSEVARDVPLARHACLRQTTRDVTKHDVHELVNERALAPVVDASTLDAHLLTTCDAGLEPLWVVDQLEPAGVLVEANASGRDAGHLHLVHATRERSEERLVEEQAGDVEVEVEGGLVAGRGHVTNSFLHLQYSKIGGLLQPPTCQNDV